MAHDRTRPRMRGGSIFSLNHTHEIHLNLVLGATVTVAVWPRKTSEWCRRDQHPVFAASWCIIRRPAISMPSQIKSNKISPNSPSKCHLFAFASRRFSARISWWWFLLLLAPLLGVTHLRINRFDSIRMRLKWIEWNWTNRWKNKQLKSFVLYLCKWCERYIFNSIFGLVVRVCAFDDMVNCYTHFIDWPTLNEMNGWRWARRKNNHRRRS